MRTPTVNDKPGAALRQHRRAAVRSLAALGRDQRGAVAVEWAFIAGIFVILLLGVASYGAAAIHRMQMANAVRGGLQYATARKPIQGDLSQIRSTILTGAPDDTTGTQTLNVTLYCQCSDESSVACDRARASRS